MDSGLRPLLSGKIAPRSAEMLDIAVVPAKAGRSAKRGERPKDGPEGVGEANHPATCNSPKSHWSPGVRRGDESVVLNFREKIHRPAMAELSFLTVMFSPDSNGPAPE
jgi:hypothetical protein